MTTLQARALTAAKTRIGDPYVWGGAGPNGFDCSGLTLWSYRQAHLITLVHASALQYDSTPKIAVPAPGDLVFFLGVSGPPYPGHCGICSAAPIHGIGKMIHAEETGTNVMESEFATSGSQWVGATRPVQPAWPGVNFSYPPYSKGPTVQLWQMQMDIVWGYKLTQDGIYGPASKAACQDFQHKHGLTTDGIVGKITWGAVFS